MSQDITARRAVETRRLYSFENHYLSSPYLNQRRSLAFMTRMAKRIWKAEGMTKKLPVLRFGPGVYQNDRWLSYCAWDDSYIEFAPKERNIVTLIHELVHASGARYRNHDTQFVRRLFELLEKYGRCNYDELVFASYSFGVKP